MQCCICVVRGLLRRWLKIQKLYGFAKVYEVLTLVSRFKDRRWTTAWHTARSTSYVLLLAQLLILVEPCWPCESKAVAEADIALARDDA